MTIDATGAATIVSQFQAFFAELGQQGFQAAQPGSATDGADAPNDPFAILLAAAGGAGSDAPSAVSNATTSAAGANATEASATGTATSSTATPPGGANAIVTDAERYLGVPYQWGGTSPQTGFDCSGLVQHVFADLGVSLPRTAAEQADTGTPIPTLADAQPGDLLFFEPGQNGAGPGQPGHVGIYIGNDEMIDAPHTGADVSIQTVPGQPMEIRREVVPTSTTTSASAAAAGAPSGMTTIGSVEVPSTYAPIIEQASASSGVPASLLAALLQTESGFDPTAVSSAGAEGIAQLMPATAASAGVDPNDPAQAIPVAASILAANEKATGSWALALAAYNAGLGAVQQAGGIPQNGTTPAYVTTILNEAGLSAPAQAGAVS